MKKIRTIMALVVLVSAAAITLARVPSHANASQTSPDHLPTGIERTREDRAEYAIDAVHSSVGFAVKHMVVATVKGRFQKFSGKVSYDADYPANSSIEVTIDVGSIDTDNEQRDNHLRSAEFFDAENHPNMTFKSSRVERRGDSFVAFGDLTMRGLTRPIELPFELLGPVTGMRGETRYGADATIRLNRKDWGVSWNQTLDAGGVVVSETVTVEIHVELVRQ